MRFCWLLEVGIWTKSKQSFKSGISFMSSLTGYFSKYDNSSADLNPIGTLSKIELKNLLSHYLENYCTPQRMSVIKE